MQIIQIAGIGRVGKTTLSLLIAKQLFNSGYIPVILPFAKALKDMAQDLGYDKQKNSVKYREFCQELGASKRKEDLDYWVKQTAQSVNTYNEKEKISKSTSAPKKYILIQDDVRYMNELAFGMGINSFRIFLSAGSRPIQEEDAAWRKHESETLNNNLNNQLMTSFFGKKNIEKKVDLTDLFNVVLLNDKTEEYLEAKVEKYISSWLDVTKHIDKLSLIKELVK